MYPGCSFGGHGGLKTHTGLNVVADLKCVCPYKVLVFLSVTIVDTSLSPYQSISICLSLSVCLSVCLSVYRSIYHSLFSMQDALVAAYPRIANDEKNHFARDELDYFI